MNKNILKRPYIIFRIILWLILLVFLGFFIYKGVVPSGVISYSYDFRGGSRFFSDLRPPDRVSDLKDGVKKMIGDPLYFSLYTPRPFDVAEMSISYEANNTPAVIEAGVMVDKENWLYNLKPLSNRILNQLSLAWEVIKDNDIVLLQKEKKYSTVDDFLADLPAIEKIAVYNYDLDFDYKMADYEPLESGEVNELPLSLKGSWQSLLYLKNEDLETKFEFLRQEHNSYEEIELKLFYKESLIASKNLVFDEEKMSLEESFSALNLPEGVYTLELKASDNIITKRMTLKQKKIVFSSKLDLVSDEKKEFSVFTDSKNVQLTTVSPESLQTVKMNDKEFEINKTYKQFEIKTEKASSTLPFASLSFEKADFILSGDGVFTFSGESFFNPKIKKLDRNIDIIKDGVEYVIARYNYPKEEKGLKATKVFLDMKNAFRENGEYEFMISVPGMRVDDEIEDSLVIDKITINLRGKSLKERLKEFFIKQ